MRNDVIYCCHHQLFITLWMKDDLVSICFCKFCVRERVSINLGKRMKGEGVCDGCLVYRQQQQLNKLIMNRELVQGNKIVYQKMCKKQRLRHLQRLQQIKNRPFCQSPQDPNQFRHTSLFDSQRNLQIERNNIALFNKIATILKEKPKPILPKSRHYVKSLDQAMFQQERKMEELKIKNEDLLKRINRQQPTIKNDLITKDRVRNEQYLSFIGRYPFKRNRRSNTDFELIRDERQEVFHQKSLDFDITIHHRPDPDQYVFVVKDLAQLKQYALTMEGTQFKEQLAECNLSYEKMVGRLRMLKTGEMVFGKGRSTSQSQINQK